MPWVAWDEARLNAGKGSHLTDRWRENRIRTTGPVWIGDRNYYAEPDAKIANRSMHWPRGRVLGGTSSINGMLYVRGNPVDYDGWAQMGCRGWSYADVLPYFKKSERYGPGDTQYRGKSGLLLVEDYRTILPLTHRLSKPRNWPASRSPATTTVPSRKGPRTASAHCRARSHTVSPASSSMRIFALLVST